MWRILVLLLPTLLLCRPLPVAAQALEYHGAIRSLLSAPAGNHMSILNQAEQLQAGLFDLPARSGLLETELHLSGHGMSALATLRGQTDEFGNTHSTACFNELFATIGDGAWQWSAGKKVVEWDVGYGFRPNDVVQQEKRRALIGNAPIGRPLAMLEYFDANLAASLVWVNPQHAGGGNPAKQQAVAARLYYRAGSVDLHGFGHYSASKGASLGVATAWVASDALELHASARYLRQSSTLALDPATALLQPESPWRTQTQNDPVQVLLGASWTSENQHSILLEAWWDGTAPNAQQWTQWNQRNRALIAAVPGMPQWRPLIAYNLAWQSGLMSFSENLQRKNLFARWSRRNGAWQPALDLLWNPQDGGRVWTAALSWQGDQLGVTGGLRLYGGPARTVLAQLPLRRQLYISSSWAF